MGYIPGLQVWFHIHRSINMMHHRNGRKDKNNRMLSTEVGKLFDKMSHPFMIKTLSKVHWDSTYLHIKRSSMQNPQLISSSMGKN